MSAIGRLILFITLNALSFMILFSPNTVANTTVLYYSKMLNANLSWLPLAVATLLALAASQALTAGKYARFNVTCALLAYIMLQGLPCIPDLSLGEKTDALMTVTRTTTIIGAGLLL